MKGKVDIKNGVLLDYSSTTVHQSAVRVKSGDQAVLSLGLISCWSADASSCEDVSLLCGDMLMCARHVLSEVGDVTRGVAVGEVT